MCQDPSDFIGQSCTRAHVGRKLGTTLSLTNVTPTEKTTALLPILSDRNLTTVFPQNALTSILSLAIYQYLWVGDIHDTGAEKTTTLHMPGQVIAELN